MVFCFSACYNAIVEIVKAGRTFAPALFYGGNYGTDMGKEVLRFGSLA